MLVFADNDVVTKLVEFDIFDIAIAALDVELDEFNILDTLKYVEHLKDVVRLSERRGSAAAGRLLKIVPTLREITDVGIDEIFEDIVNIDAGEAVLLSAALQSSGSMLWTGDKRAITAIASHPSLDTVREQLKGRIVCLEQVVLQTIENEGFATVRDRLLPSLGLGVLSRGGVDTAIRSAFGAKEQATEDNVVFALNGYIDDLRSRSGTLLSS
ncbi:MAG: hypothetical protein ACI8P0_003052 [Planctomycetaceae bacterium]|jgi:hypothetical protein